MKNGHSEDDPFQTTRKLKNLKRLIFIMTGLS